MRGIAYDAIGDDKSTILEVNNTYTRCTLYIKIYEHNVHMTININCLHLSSTSEVAHPATILY